MSKTIHTLADRAMTVNLNMGLWQGYRLDKEASREVTERANSDSDAARVNKHLVPKAALKDVVAAQGAIRTHLYAKTLPWKDNGDRVLTRKMYESFISEHERLAEQFHKAVEAFLTRIYPTEVERAGFRMGTMFDPNDYPTASELRHRFYVRLSIDAVTTSNDFRVQIDADAVNAVKASMDKAAEQRVAQAVQDVWTRLIETVGYAQSRLANPEAVFRDTTITNVTDLIKLVPGLNLLDDPHLDAMCKELEAAFGGTTLKELRKDTSVRSSVATEANEVLEKMRGFAAAFGSGQP